MWFGVRFKLIYLVMDFFKSMRLLCFEVFWLIIDFNLGRFISQILVNVAKLRVLFLLSFFGDLLGIYLLSEFKVICFVYDLFGAIIFSKDSCYLLTFLGSLAVFLVSRCLGKSIEWLCRSILVTELMIDYVRLWVQGSLIKTEITSSYSSLILIV